MATTKKPPARRKATPKVRKGSTATKTVAETDRPRVVKTATRKAAASDPRAARVASRQRRLQDQEKAKDARATRKATKKTATQAGARRQPETMPAQHLAKPGHEHALELAPRFLAPDYVGSGKLQGMRAIITGGDSGIGRAVAVLFAREGADVAVLHLDEAEDADLTRQHVEREGGRCVVIAGDVRDPRFCNKAVKQVAKAFGGIDILVNNAGIFGPQDFFDTDDATWERYWQTNVMSGVRLARALLPAMVDAGWGRVLFISSESARNIPADMIHYGVSKTAQLSLSRGLAKRVAGSGVTVNAVLPGPTLSDGFAAMFEEERARSGKPLEQIGREFVMAHRPASVIQRAATVEEVANMVVYLASAQASATSGAALRVDGGVVDDIV